MKAEEIKSVDDISLYIEGCLNDLEGGISTKEETDKYLHELVTRVTEVATQSHPPREGAKEGAKEDLFEKAKNALEKYILENPDKVAQDLDVMRALQTTPPQANTVTDEDQLFNFFVWFRANGENHTDKPIEKMIEIYLSQQPEPSEVCKRKFCKRPETCKREGKCMEFLT